MTPTGWIVIGIAIGLIVYIIIDKLITGNINPLKDNFQESQEKIMIGLKEKKNAFDKELSQEQLIKREELRKKLEDLDKNYEDQKQSYKIKLDEIKEDYESRRDHIKNLDAAAEQERNREQADKIQQERDAYNQQLKKLSEDYKEKKEILDKDFFEYGEQVSKKREQLTKEIEGYENRQKEIIARFKEDEEKRQQTDYYSIKINEIEKQDIAKLKSLSASFSKPEILLKLTYETYYKMRLEEMFKRVLGENKDKGGIYKITNINNQKVYIGKTVKFIDRWRTHAKRGCGIERIKGQLYDAMFSEGLENFTWEIIEVCPKEEQTEKEKYWTNFYHSSEYGYNVKVG